MSDVIVENGNTTVMVDTGVLNIGPTAALLMAQDFLKCYLDFKKPRKHSLVPYFLCCSAIELALKSIHLETKKKGHQGYICHDLEKLYSYLSPGKIDLSPEEVSLLVEANKIYSTKDFEYFNTVRHMMQGCRTFPDLNALAEVARKVTGYTG